jgi:SAM-dependent methyltransferase
VKRCLGCSSEFEAPRWRCERCGWEPTLSDGRPLFAPSLADGGGLDAWYPFEDFLAVEPCHFWFRSRRRLIVWALARYFPRARRLLDVGCGAGFVLLGLQQTFPTLELSGGDLLAEAIRYAAARVPDASFFQMDARQIPFTSEFDLVAALDVIEHVTEDEAALVEMFRAVRPGGGVLLTVPQHPLLWSDADAVSCHRRRYTRRGLARKLQAVGFEILRLTSFCSLLAPLLLARRLCPRLRSGRYDTIAELRVSPANGLLERTLDAERLLIERGASLPVGSSLLVVARRPS